jgi:hypothetical protein
MVTSSLVSRRSYWALDLNEYLWYHHEVILNPKWSMQTYIKHEPYIQRFQLLR